MRAAPAAASSFAELVERAAGLAAGLVADRPRAVLGITGSPGSGKSTLAGRLLAALSSRPPAGSGPDWVTHVPMDGFHLADVELERLGRRERKGAVDTFDGWGYLALLRRLRTETQVTVYAPGFERTVEQPIAASIAVPPSARLVITEGNYLLVDEPPWDAVRGTVSETWFCATDPVRRRVQLTARHAAFGKPAETAYAWATGPDEVNARLVESTRERADLLVPEVLLRSLG